MEKLDFCPYDGKRIELNNLAYELIHPNGWDWNRIKKETVISNRNRAYIVEYDMKRQEKLEFVDKENHVIVLANSDENCKNGLTLLRELIEYGDQEVTTELSLTSFEESMKRLYGMKFNINGKTKQEELNNFENLNQCSKKLHYSFWQGLHTFFDENDDPVMYALPCCPYCHNRLPVGWTDADDFIGISLMGPKGVGKTSFLYSLMHNKAESLARPLLISGEYLTIRPAHFEMDKKDTIYAYVTEQSSLMCKENGKCPNSLVGVGNMPVFLRVQYGSSEKQKTLIVGIYDNASEYLEKMDTISNGNLNRLIEKIYADFYLFDPRDMQFQNLSPKRMSGYSRFVKCSMMSLDEQANYQSQNKKLIISAKELLATREENISVRKDSMIEENISTMRLYNCLVSLYRRYSTSDILKNKRFFGVITKNDLLCKQLDENYTDLIWDTAEETEYTFGQIKERSKMTEDMIGSYGMLGNIEMEKFQRDYGKGASWHCISATGCDVVENDHLLGDYKPIHVADPIIFCVLSRMQDMNWI